jgi:DNA repair protein RecN (Recombination protein N)
VLDELDIRNFVLADSLRVRFDHGFSAITGETGAGKSLIVDALGILLGDRAGPDLIRTGASSASIEGTFSIAGADEELSHLLEDTGIAPENGVLIISRDLSSAGRSSSRINGRAVVQSTLAAVGGRLMDIHTQTDHLAIIRPHEQVQYLDRFAGVASKRERLGAEVSELRRIRSELEQLRSDARERLRQQERLEYELQEIHAARLEADEEEVLQKERRRLGNAQELSALAMEAYAALEGDGETAGASGPIGEAAALTRQLARLDEAMDAEASALEVLQSQVSDLARGLRAYGEQVEFSPERLQEIEERLEVISRLKRKYGASIEEVLDYGSRAARELESLEGSEERTAVLNDDEQRLIARISVAADALARSRRTAARELCAAIEGQLADLGLGGGRFGVRFEVRPDEAGIPVRLASTTIEADSVEELQQDEMLAAIDRTGAERIEFLVSLNRGEPLRPLARVASGGEMARLMLALKTVLGQADSVPTLIFDEVDVGVGGRSGRVVGEKLAGLAGHHQVICVTHLPQIAALAGCHIVIEKRVEGDTIVVEAKEVHGDARIEEVAAMLGGTSAANRAAARELLGDTIC